jgi:hypothetical protein
MRASSSVRVPGNRSAIRKYVYDSAIEYIENGAGQLESRERAAEFALEFQSSDRSVSTTPTRSSSSRGPFPIGPLVLPAGGTYQFDTFRWATTSDSSAAPPPT